MNRTCIQLLVAGRARFAFQGLLVAALGLGVACGDAPGPTGTESGVNLRIETLYLVQSVQTRERTVPLVAGKGALLRVFVVSNSANVSAPAVRVSLIRDGSVQQVFTIAAPTAFTPTSIDQARLTKSWNLEISAATLVPGLQILAVVDPDDAVQESNEDDNQFPASGAPLALQVAELPPFRVRFVPMVQAENGRTGNVNTSNIDDYMTFTRRIHPVSSIDADLRAPYTVNGLGFDPQGNTWQAAVAELDAVRVAEGSDRFYYGVVNTEYEGGGVVGIAAGIPAGTALGWDRFPDAPITLAHEMGHAWGRFHAPCGGAGGADASYPYPLGLIGVHGLDLGTKEVKLPNANTDIMGYCNTRFWISDYTYSGIFNYRLENEVASMRAPEPSLVVWGRIDNGFPKLEPAFQAVTRPLLPSGLGPYRIVAEDALGEQLFAYSFAGKPSSDGAKNSRHFAFAIPLSDQLTDRIAVLRVIAPQGESRRVSRREPSDGAMGAASRAAGPSAIARVSGNGTANVLVRWDGQAYPLAVVRDASTGSILGLARGGEAEVFALGREVQVSLSDGVRSFEWSGLRIAQPPTE